MGDVKIGDLVKVTNKADVLYGETGRVVYIRIDEDKVQVSFDEKLKVWYKSDSIEVVK